MPSTRTAAIGVAALLSVALIWPPPASAAEGNVSVQVRAVPENPRAGDRVEFVIDYRDPDPLTTVDTIDIDFGNNRATTLCCGMTIACTEVLYLRGAEGSWRGFEQTYTQPGDYLVVVRVTTVQHVCGAKVGPDDVGERALLLHVGAGT